MPAFEEFSRYYPGVPDDAVEQVYCPYRLCPLGAHSDHQHGLISGFAIDRGVELCFVPQEQPLVELYSCDFEGRVRFATDRDTVCRNDWGRYAQGAVAALRQSGIAVPRGLRGVIKGSLPIGGLSSSAAVIICYLLALCKVNGISVSGDRLIDLALYAEKDYVGLNVGRLDQSCEVLSRKDSLLYLDTQTGEYRTIPQSSTMPPYEFAVIFSGVSRTLTGTAFNKRVDECRAAAYIMRALEGMDYDRVEGCYLRDVPQEVFSRWEKCLPEPFARRCRHFYGEFARVQEGIEAWRHGDLVRFGELVFASGESSIRYYETGSAELIALYEIMKETPGIYGGRFSGAGFKGCCMAIVDPAQEDGIREHITQAYLSRFPQYADSFSITFCHSADGARVVE